MFRAFLQKREQEKKRVVASSRFAQVQSEITNLCEKALPFSIAGKLFDGVRRRIESEAHGVHLRLGRDEVRPEPAQVLHQDQRVLLLLEEPDRHEGRLQNEPGFRRLFASGGQ